LGLKLTTEGAVVDHDRWEQVRSKLSPVLDICVDHSVSGLEIMPLGLVRGAETIGNAFLGLHPF
jgi:hypothetical protein